MIGLSRTTFRGKSGLMQCLPFGSYTGSQQGTPVTVDSPLPGRLAIARVLRDEWNIAGKTLTIRIYRNVAGNWGLYSQGIVDSGPTAVKGVAEPNPMLPIIGLEDQGEFRVDIETSSSIGYTAEVV